MSTRIQILYEDQLSTGNPRNFGPHVLVLVCLGDRLARAPTSFTHVTPYACKGINRLLQRCEDRTLLDAYARVVALCDDDKVRSHVKLPAGACKLQVVTAVRSRCNGSHRLQPVLLARNLETVVDVVSELLGRAPHLPKLRPVERDPLLLRFAHGSTPEQRRELLRRVDSLGYLIEKLARCVDELGL